jgi:hypothetical protein
MKYAQNKRGQRQALRACAHQQVGRRRQQRFQRERLADAREQPHD